MEDKENAKEKSAVAPQKISKQNPKESLMDASKEARESTDKQHADGEQKDGGSVPFADFIPKWPLTRGERIKELDRLQPLFEHTSQRDNIIAMKAWHARFPSDQIVPEETVWFERGKKVEKDDIVAGQCEVWEEGPPVDDFFFNGQGTRSASPLGPAAVVTGTTRWTYYDRSPDNHMYQLKLEVKVSLLDGGTDVPYTMVVGYDSGCHSMAMSVSDIGPLMQPGAVESLPFKRTTTAGGGSRARRLALQIRILSQAGDKELVGWHPIVCNCYENSSTLCIFRGTLEQDLFTVNHPYFQRLYVARSKAQIVHNMPKGW